MMISVKVISQSFEEFGESKDDKDWSYTISPYAFLAAQSTDVGGEKIRQSFSDLSSIVNTGFQIAGSVQYKRFITRFDGTWAWLGSDVSQSALRVDVEIQQQILDFRAGYIIVEKLDQVEREVIRGWALEVNAGAKYWNNTIGLNYKLGIGDRPILEGSLDEVQQWWDFMIGINPKIYVTPKMLISTSLSIGGFGIGNSSNFSYDFLYVNSFRVSKLLGISVGFRNFQYDRVDGTGADEVDTKVNVIGPFIGLSFQLNKSY